MVAGGTTGPDLCSGAVTVFSFSTSIRRIEAHLQHADPVNAEGGYALPNNVGGFNFYRPDGVPTAFCAFNNRLGELHFFSATGARIG